MSARETDTYVSYEEEDTCVSYEEEDTCVSYEVSARETAPAIVQLLCSYCVFF